MNKTSKTILITAITVFGIWFLLVPSTLAQTQNLVVEFEETPLFLEANFLPGQGVTRWVKVTNNSNQSQRITTEAINISDSDNLGTVLNLEIKEGATALYNSPLSTFFNTGEVFLSDLAGNGTQAQYDFIVTFYSGAQNTFQGKSLSFDILVGFQGTEGGLLPGAGGGSGGFLPPGLMIFNETEEYIATTTVTITWTTSYLSTSQVIYAVDGESYSFDLTEPNYGYPHIFPEPEDTNKVIEHSVTIIGLSSGITYYYRCVSHGSFAVSTEHSFTTLEPTGEEGGEEEFPTTEEEIGEEIEEGLEEQIVYGGEPTPEGETSEIASEEGVIFEEEETGKEEKQIVISPDSTAPANPFLGFLASISDVVAGLLGPCLNWWFILILVLYSLLKAFRAWKKGKNEVKVWLIWTLILIILTICFYLKICVCLDVWVFLILGLITYFIRWITLRGEERNK